MTPIRLEKPRVAHMGEFLGAVRRSRGLHKGLVQPPSTAEAFRGYLARNRRANYVSHLVMAGEHDLVGVVNISEIVRGNFQNAFLGYCAFVPHAGTGLMSAGFALVLRHAFVELGLHRLEANIQPNNRASLRLVARHGFVKEGFSERYLKVGGRWRDHERWALIRENWRER